MEIKKIFERMFSKGNNGSPQGTLPNFTLAKMRLASHPEAKTGSLRKLASHSCENIVTRVAENQNTESDVLEQLAQHPQTEVRIAVAENLNTPSPILLLLVCDENPDVRYSLAENHNVTISILTVLAEDDNPYVADRANRTIVRLRQSDEPYAWFPNVHQDRQRGIS